MPLKWISAFSALVLLGQPTCAWAESTPSAVIAKKVGAGWVFTDQKGMSLYTFGQDKPGVSKCQGSCADLWPPVLAASDKDTMGDWSTVERTGGKKQVAFRGMPLYSYVKDPLPGTTFGDGVGLAWSVARQDMDTPPGITIIRTGYGRFLTDTRGRTLYFNTDDKAQLQQTADHSGKVGAGSVAKLKSSCTKTCLETWKPMMAPSVAVAAGDWSIVAREDGARQWAYQQKALYLPVNAVEGAQGRVWQEALVEQPPAVPEWVTYQITDAGEVLADAAGRNIYAFRNFGDNVQAWRSPNVCKAECMQTYWQPISAAADAKPVGNWTIVKGADSVNQWTYKGELLFTYKQDKEPGDLAGSRFLTRAFHTLTRNGEEMEGMDKR